MEKWKQVTFRNRMIMIFLISSLLPFICLGWISFYTIDSILDNKVESALQSNLKQDLLILENTLNNLNHVSQQLAYGGGMIRMLEQLEQEQEPYERARLLTEIKSDLNVLTFSNPNVGLLMYYYPEMDEIQFENFRVREDFDPDKLPVMASYPEMTYYGPHKSYNGSINQYVFSTMRKINVIGQDVYLYMETGRNALETLFAPQSQIQQEGNRRLLILDDQGRIAFSEKPEDYPVNAIFPGDLEQASSGYDKDFFWNREVSNQGWSIVSVLPEQELNKERNQWIIQIVGFFLVFLLLSVLFAWLLWKMVYRPLDKFNREIKSLIRSDSKDSMEVTRIPEFDYLLLQIRSMKVKIWELYADIEQKEKRRADLEVEKMLYQINPHFLMNTLDTVHWLAVMNGQKEIDKLVLSLNKLLYYNLGKLGETSTIGDEITALKEYMQLQQIRYDFAFDVDVDVDENAMSLPSPRFILQPLVENALYHGVSDDGYIHVDIKVKEQLEITIQDDGVGMSEETIQRLLEDDEVESQKVGLGIGMRYVKRMLKSNYGDQATLRIKSEKGKGTIVFLSFPITGGEETA
ncbi:sensor histidine kinase [Marinicrinis sediminis]|uniref:histidine kinase n=1 Tax=Marinicrinis sediminis TaxID=1652465 RepID=A0ABW5R809_9BACL